MKGTSPSGKAKKKRPKTPEEVERALAESVEIREKSQARKAMEGEVKRLQGGVAGTVFVLIAAFKVLTGLGVMWATFPLALVAVYLWLRMYRRIKAIREEMARRGLRSDDVDLAAENAVAPFRFLFIYGGVMVGVILAVVLLVWGAKRLESAIAPAQATPPTSGQSAR